MIFNKKILTACFTFAEVAHAFTGDATYYYTGLGNCGAYSKDTDFIVALSTAEYNGGAHCYQHIKVSYQGKTIDATVVDSCPGCSQYSIDLSPSAFEALAPLDAGRIQVDWHYV
ncbi:RlpA-like double-psi beta-barrel-protein domain-containing protein-containing protein [Flammula alnicola]|nr:RlpA-like double-psi beta-barrel-protein domain-containing protein-containing protein [Flammula alnicola]